MSVPQNKEELLKEIDKHFSVLLAKLNTLDETEVFKKVLEGHAKETKMSVAQLVSYLIGWGELVMHWHQQEESGESIIFPAEGFKWNELGLLAQKFYRDYQDITSYKHLIEKLEENNLQIMFLVESFSNDELYMIPWYGKWNRGRMIQFNTSSPYKNAKNRIAKLLK